MHMINTKTVSIPKINQFRLLLLTTKRDFQTPKHHIILAVQTIMMVFGLIIIATAAGPAAVGVVIGNLSVIDKDESSRVVLPIVDDDDVLS